MDDLTRDYDRWRLAEERDEDDAADTVFRAVFEASVSSPLPSREFTTRTMAAIADAAAADARRARMGRTILVWGGLAASIVAVYFGAGALLSMLSSAVVGALNLVISTVVWFADGGSVRSSAWAVLSGLGRAAAAFVADPRVTVALFAFQAVAIGALVALHRLLGSDRELLK
jgi:hypothetical protein